MFVFVNFQSLYSGFDFEGYLSQINYMKKDVMHLVFFCLSSSLVLILFHDNTWLNVGGITLQKLTDLRYENFPHPPYSLDLPFDNYILIFIYFKHLDTFLCQKTFCFKGEVETELKDFLALKFLESYFTDINNLHRCSEILFWLIKTLFKFINS